MPSHAFVEMFTTSFEHLTDPRIDRTKAHRLLDVLLVALCAAIGGANDWAAVERFGKAKLDFFRRFVELRNGIPSHDTFGRVFALLDPAGLVQCIQQWLAHLSLGVGRQVAIDGKTLRGSYDTKAGKNPLHLVSAWACEARLTLGQVAVDAKSNEITAIPVLLELLDLKGATVTIDAMGCQKEIAAAVRAKEADYILAVKDNQPSLHDAVRDAFLAYAEDDFVDPSLRRLTTVDNHHGRKETRQYVIAPAPAALVAGRQWKDVHSIGLVIRTRAIGGESTTEVSYYLGSVPVQVKKFAKAVRGHWGIENQLHWSLDVTFAEDRSRVRKGNGPENYGMLRRLALTILQQDTTSKDNLTGKRQSAGWDDSRLERILAGFAGK